MSSASLTPEQALAALLEGNRRFVSGAPRDRQDVEARRRALVAGQQPMAVVLSCSDSRVPPEIVFDQGLGDLFAVRVAGHVLDPVVLGSVEFGVLHLGAPLVLVLGHQSCGAVTAALGPAPDGSDNLDQLLEGIRPVVSGLNIDAAIRAHVAHTVACLAENQEVVERVRAGLLRVAGGVYRLATGEVDLLPDSLPADA